jgi:diaminohydroxyphosphoribosylaminopyrimidine deaminase/5-amino-6-(5-phosphoribosylamino)uracil reductase
MLMNLPRSLQNYKVNNNMDQKQDAEFMARAIGLAKKGWNSTDPNPRVGCVIARQGQILGQGWHKKAGEAHAETIALNDAGDVAEATAYVTLEPCSHVGQTPSCADALIEAGISRVVVAMRDPNPLVAGAGLKKLEMSGISVEIGVLESEARLLNLGFISRMNRQRPYVVSKMACSFDGRTAMASGESKWITSTEARVDVQRLRAGSSAVLTGVGTVLADDPSLNVRIDDPDELQPLRVVLDSQLRMPVTAKILTLPGTTMILTGLENTKQQQALEQAGADVFKIDLDDDGRIDLDKMLLFLGQQQINQVLVEAGPILNGALMVQKLIDEYVIYMAPIVMGDAGRGLFRLPEVKAMSDKIMLQLVETRQVGHDLRFRYRLQG